jgi:hypothetical protein
MKDGHLNKCKSCCLLQASAYGKTERGREVDRNRYYRNKEKRDYLSRKNRDEREYAGLREKAILLAGEKCQWCGITREEHKKIWNIDLHCDHIDQNRDNNGIDNLRILCIKCHGKHHSHKYWNIKTN